MGLALHVVMREHGQPSRARVAAACVRVAIFAIVLAVVAHTEADPDLWGHILGGRDIATSGIPRADPYSFTSDRPWINPNWLAEVAMARAWDAGGSAGLVGLKLALVLGALALVLRALAAQGVRPIHRDLLAFLWVGGVYAATLTARPHHFSLLLFAVLLTLVLRARGRPVVLAAIPPLMLLWANTHGSWPIGVAVLGIWWLCEGLPALRHSPSGAIVRAAIVAVSLLATLVTPYGTDLWRLLGGVGLPGNANLVSEWQSVLSDSPARGLPWLLVTLVALAAIRRSTSRPDLWIAAVLVFLAVCSFRVTRLVMFFATAAVMLLAPQLARLGRASAPSSGRGGTSRSAALVVGASICIVLGAGLSLSRDVRCIHMTYEWGPDTDAAAFVRHNHLRGRMITWVDWGEYAMWWFAPDVLISMDPRRETVYSADTTAAHLDLYFDRPGAAAYVERVGADYVWLPRHLPGLRSLKAPVWTPLFESSRSVVLGRSPGRAPDVPAPTTPPACFPGDPGR